MVGLALTLVLAGAPGGSRVFIAAGARTKPEAQKLAASLKVPAPLRLTPGYPRLVDSKTIAGLKPGFFVVVLGACADETAAQQRHGNGLAALIQRSLRGAYAKPVAAQPEACPLWLEPAGEPADRLAALVKAPDDLGLLLEVAGVRHREGALSDASILLRRALALGATDEPTLALFRTVEFLMEEAPDRLPD